jgi:hypothetical protein
MNQARKNIMFQGANMDAMRESLRKSLKAEEKSNK